MTSILGSLPRQLGTAILQALGYSPQPEPGESLQPPPRREYTHYARPGPRADGLTPDQAALATVERRGLPCHILDTAMAEGLGTGRVEDACLVLKHAPNLIESVNDGRSLFQAAIIARLRRDAPDLAAKAEARMTGDTSKDSHMLHRTWVKVAARKAAAGDRRFGQRDYWDRLDAIEAAGQDTP